MSAFQMINLGHNSLFHETDGYNALCSLRNESLAVMSQLGRLTLELPWFRLKSDFILSRRLYLSYFEFPKLAKICSAVSEIWFAYNSLILLPFFNIKPKPNQKHSVKFCSQTELTRGERREREKKYKNVSRRVVLLSGYPSGFLQTNIFNPSEDAFWV